jgi:hypothetical protein
MTLTPPEIGNSLPSLPNLRHHRATQGGLDEVAMLLSKNLHILCGLFDEAKLLLYTSPLPSTVQTHLLQSD